MSKARDRVKCNLLALGLLAWVAGCVSPPPSQPTANGGCLAGQADYVASTLPAPSAVLVLASDAHPDTVRRSLPLLDRVGRALMSPLLGADVRLFDGHSLRTPLKTQQRASVPRLLERAVSDSREAMDRLIIYSVFADTFPTADAFRVKLRVAAQLYDLTGGNLLMGNFEAADELRLVLPAICDSACFVALVGDAARPLGQKVGQAVSAELGSAGASYPVELFGFSNKERLQLEQGLRAFPGYRNHRVEEDGAEYVRLRYGSSLAAADLGQNLRRLTRCLALPSQVEFAGARYSVRRSAVSFQG